MRREHRDPYVVLGVGRQASAAEIARAFRRAARATHPDGSPGSTRSGEGFQAVSDAYATLRDPHRRAAYDLAHPLVRRGDAASPPGRPGSVRYGASGGQHIVLGAPSQPSPVVAADTEVEALVRLVLSVLGSHW